MLATVYLSSGCRSVVICRQRGDLQSAAQLAYVTGRQWVACSLSLSSSLRFADVQVAHSVLASWCWRKVAGWAALAAALARVPA